MRSRPGIGSAPSSPPTPFEKAAQEVLMKKIFILAALLMASTSVHAGGISFEIEGQRIRIEAPRNCDSLSCLKITAPGFKGFKSKRFDDDDDATYRDDRISRDDPPPAKYAPAPVQAAPQPAA